MFMLRVGLKRKRVLGLPRSLRGLGSHDEEEVGGHWETGFYEIRRPISDNSFVILIDLCGVLAVRCSSRGPVLSLVVCHSRKIDEVASGVRHVSGGVTSSVQILDIWLAKRASIPYPVSRC
ncbi:hypothetical protein TNCV_4976661 [Trichonephila clavipes]|nr:hypothetical protein TNCV_4976661 [Trichonephila clavipes]